VPWGSYLEEATGQQHPDLSVAGRVLPHKPQEGKTGASPWSVVRHRLEPRRGKCVCPSGERWISRKGQPLPRALCSSDRMLPIADRVAGKALSIAS
jgi:hypothetical protein